MDIELRKHLINMVEFLGIALGPYFEVILFDTLKGSNTILAIANGFVSGRKIGSTMCNIGEEIVEQYNDKNIPLLDNYHDNYTTYTDDGKRLRSSAFYIKDENSKLVGLLVINFNDQRYVEISKDILGLCHPDSLLNKTSFEQVDESYFARNKNTQKDITAITENIIKETVEHYRQEHPKFNKQIKQDIIQALNEQKVFLVKGSISLAAKELDISEASIYRYISETQ